MHSPYLMYLDLSSSSTHETPAPPPISWAVDGLCLSGDVAKPSLAMPPSAAFSPPLFDLRKPGIDGIEGIAGIFGIEGIAGIDGIDALPNHPDIWDLTFENIPPAFVGLKKLIKRNKN